jgi:probable addiction module antidote protein
MPDYKDDLLKDLRKSPEYAAKYLSAAVADSPEAFLVALRDVADSQKGIAGLAATAAVNRENLYRMLSEGGNPRLQSLTAILKALHLRLSIEPLRRPKHGRAKRLN